MVSIRLKVAFESPPVGIEIFARMSSGPVPIRHTHFVPPSSTPPSSGFDAFIDSAFRPGNSCRERALRGRRAPWIAPGTQNIAQLAHGHDIDQRIVALGRDSHALKDVEPTQIGE